MKRFLPVLIFIITFSINAKITAKDVIQKLDDVINAPKDQKMKMRLIVIDTNGKEKEKLIEIIQKGNEKRMGKFLLPEDQKGIGFLSLQNGVFYVYLPAMKKTQLIASQSKGGKFAGTDFTYEDLETKKYEDYWDGEIIKEDEKNYYLKMKPKPDYKSSYGSIIITVDKEIFYPVNIEFYDKGGNMIKTLKREKIERVNGYLVSRYSEMKDLKSGNTTKMIIEDIKFDIGIQDNQFKPEKLSD